MARYALVIGVSQYQKPLGNLEKTTSDAEAVAQILEQRGDFQKVIRLPARFNPDKSVYEMVPRAVTGAELGQAIKDFFLERAEKSEALIYFTGHGITVADHLGQQKGYLAPSDCVIETQGKDIVEQRHGIALDSLNDLIRASNLSSLVLLLDCCHGGYFLERNLVEQTLTAFSSQKDYYLITACRGFEQAWAIKTEQHDVFTGALLRGLAPDNAGRDGGISGDRLFDYISSELKDSRQEPIRMGWGRSIKLITYPIQHLPTLETAPLFKTDNPYLGLNAFALEQADYFGGREQIVRVLIDHLTKSRFLAVIGPSGCGKSSLVKAGLFPLFKRNGLPGSSQWEIEAFTPGNYPTERLREILVRQQQRSEPFVLFIDQFEELFTLCSDDEERRNFIRLMSQEATNSERPTKVIIAIRGDFIDRCAAYPEAASLINQTQPNLVTPLTLLELNEAIEKPANLHGVSFESGLVSQVTNDVVDRPGALPLLQYALTELWRVCIEEVESPQPCLTWHGYREIGGVKGALEKRADLLYLSFSPEDQVFVRRLFLELVQIGEGQEFTRRRASWEDLRAIADSPEQLDRVTRRLSDQQQRLIITSDKTVEVAHEALFSEWKLLHDWIEESREDIQLNRRLEAACRDWQDIYQKSEDALLTGAPLAAIEAWVQKSQPKLPLQEAEFLQKSVEKRDRELQTQLEQERRLREEAEARAKAEFDKAQEAKARVEAEKKRGQIVLSSGLLVTALVILLAFLQILSSIKQAKIARIGEVNALISEAETYYKTYTQIEALGASLKALEKLVKLNEGDERTLNRINTIVAGVHEENRLESHEAAVNAISFNAKAKLIASASSDKTIKIWDLDKSLSETSLDASHDADIWSVNFNSNGKYIASAGADKNIKIWKRDGTLMDVLNGHQGDVTSVSFSPDDKTLISSGVDGSIRIWKINLNRQKIVSEPPKIIQDHQGVVLMVSISPDGQIFASANDDSTIKIWSKDGSLIATLKGHKALVRYVSFSSDGRSLISADENNLIKIWKPRVYPRDWSDETFTNDGNKTFTVKFSPNNKLVAATSANGSVQIWNAHDKRKIGSVGRHKDQVYDLAFISNTKIVTASRDKTVRIWNIDFDQNVSTFNKGSNADIRSLLGQGCIKMSNYLAANQDARIRYKDVDVVCNKNQ